MTAGLIDLDAQPGVSAAPLGRPHPRAVLGLLTVLLLLTLGAATPLPRPVPAAIIPATFLDETFVDGDRLYVVGPAAGTGLQLMRIFRLPDARPLGRMEIGYPGSVSGVRRVGRVLLITAGGPSVTVAVDAGTGRQLWQFGATVLTVSADTVLMTTTSVLNDGAVWALDPLTGVVRWKVDQPVGGGFLVASRWLVTTSRQGRIASYDGRSGALLASVQTRLAGFSYNYTAGDQFLIGDAEGLTAYGLPGLTPRWHVATDRREDFLQADCVRILCSYYGQQGVGVRDPATGRSLWSSSHWDTIAPVGDGLIGAADQGSLDGVPLFLLDPATGRSRGDYGGWRAVVGPDGSLRYALHPAATPNDYWFGELDPARPAVRILGEAPQVSGHCDASAGALIYHRIDGTIAVWRFG
jgi:outer membrane protein assembly factor BamB